ncbi:MAG: acetyltransferase [Candidatus Brocadiaceae bacterium]|nr:acetyltransferase [Candidatus Brocadiaceae bacterium]
MEIIIVGAGGHTRSLINLLELNKYEIIGIYDDSYNSFMKETINEYEVKNSLKHLPPNYPVVLAVGDCRKRERLYGLYKRQILKDSLIHPKAHIEKRVHVGNSNQVFSMAIINCNVRIGENNIINTGCIIEHECCIGSHNHISIGSIIAGRVKIGNRCFIGAGVVVIDKQEICDDVIIGANAVVIENITLPGTYVGNPARRIG